MSTDYEIIFYDHGDLDPYDCNVDVEICFHDGRRYSCSVFTPRNIESLLAKFARSGEYLNGKYFYCPDMIIINHFDRQIVKSVVDDIVNSNRVDVAMKALED